MNIAEPCGIGSALVAITKPRTRSKEMKNKDKILELLNRALEHTNEACERGCCYVACTVCPISQVIKYINEACDYAAGDGKDD